MNKWKKQANILRKNTGNSAQLGEDNNKNNKNKKREWLSVTPRASSVHQRVPVHREASDPGGRRKQVTERMHGTHQNHSAR